MELWVDSSSVLEVMLYKEKTTYAQHDYFAQTAKSANALDANAIPVDPACRKVMTKWCISLCKFCNYDRDMIASIMSCVDRFVATPRGSRILWNRDDYQLVVMASLYLVTKIQQRQALQPESMAKLSRGKYSKDDVEAMELEILIALNWSVNPPTPMSFAHEFVKNFRLLDDEYDVPCAVRTMVEDRILELIHCQVDEAASDYELSCLHRQSHVAFAALVNALGSLDMDPFDLQSVKALKEQLEINEDCSLGGTFQNMSTALMRIASSSEDSSSALLIQRSCGLSNSSRNKTEKDVSDSSLSASSSIHSSPRAVAGDILC
mmetsp:Transcript_16797/g.38498  ORF Transcript_16797/g.38498 Transcript_16797/m.38498 type:complete len:320 (-) Transcript_16797:42-1001(-)